jgi:hypothetical protein
MFGGEGRPVRPRLVRRASIVPRGRSWGPSPPSCSGGGRRGRTEWLLTGATRTPVRASGWTIDRRPRRGLEHSIRPRRLHLRASGSPTGSRCGSRCSRRRGKPPSPWGWRGASDTTASPLRCSTVTSFVDRSAAILDSPRPTGTRPYGVSASWPTSSRNGIVVVCALISPYQAARDEVRALHDGRFFEVHIATPHLVCANRDPKGLYARKQMGRSSTSRGSTTRTRSRRTRSRRSDTDPERAGVGGDGLGRPSSLTGALSRRSPASSSSSTSSPSGGQ